jgi:hypothetical protein
MNLFDPFVIDVAEGRRVDEGKANEKNVGFVVRDLPQSIVFLLTF